MTPEDIQERLWQEAGVLPNLIQALRSALHYENEELKGYKNISDLINQLDDEFKQKLWDASMITIAQERGWID